MDASHTTRWKDRLRQARIERNWRQHEVAEHLGASVLTVQRWERGSHQPSMYFQLKLCALFGKSAEDLGFVPSNQWVSDPPTNREAEHPLPVSFSSPEASGLWNVPYVRNPHFTGREELLEQLARYLAFEDTSEGATTRRAVLSQPQAVRGLGGIGKTQIAVEYAYRAREQGYYTHTIWINAASEEAIITSFQTLVAQLPRFPARDEKDQHQLIAAILRWLQECQQAWLLIFDNADELALVQSYLPQQGQGSILLTTRATAVNWLANSIAVEQMGLREGTHFLLHRTRRFQVTDKESNEATNVVIALDGFPLALDQAGAYIEETGCSFSDYLQLYERHRARLLARRGRQATNYPASVATTWLLSFQKVEQAHPAAAELLRLCASLSPDHIPEELLTQGAASWPLVLQEAVADPFSFNALLETLLSFSLVKRLAEEHLLSLHRLVQAVQLDQMDPEEQHCWAERVVCGVHALFPADPKNEVETWPQCLRYLEQVQACDQLILRHHLWLPQAADLLDRAGAYLCEHASYSLAETLFQRALTIAEQQLGPEHLQVASPLVNLGHLYYRQSKYELVEPLLQRALRIREYALGPRHPEVASPLNNLGHLYAEQGQYELAQSLYQRALRILEQALGSQHSQVASPLNGLANLSREQGQYKQAEALYQRTLSLRQQSLGSQHPQVAETLHELAWCYQMQQQTTKAFSLYQQALEIREQALGPHHPKTMTTRTAYTLLMGQTEGFSGSPREACQAEETCSFLHQAVQPSSTKKNDPLQGFLDACCELHPQAWCRSADLWQAYKHWVEDYQEHYPLSRGAFIAQLKAHGCHADRTKMARIWCGIALVKKHDDGG